MENQPPIDRPAIRIHKRQFAWQILLPFLVMTGLIIAGAVLVVSGEASETGVWADISLIWLIVPVLFFSLMFLAILIAMIYGILKISKILPVYTGKTQTFFEMLSVWTRKVADATIRPVLWLRQIGAAVKHIFKF